MFFPQVNFALCAVLFQAGLYPDRLRGVSELLTAVDSCFDLWRKSNEVLRKLCGII